MQKLAFKLISKDDSITVIEILSPTVFPSSILDFSELSCFQESHITCQTWRLNTDRNRNVKKY